MTGEQPNVLNFTYQGEFVYFSETTSSQLESNGRGLGDLETEDISAATSANPLRARGLDHKWEEVKKKFTGEKDNTGVTLVSVHLFISIICTFVISDLTY
jgi:hypothetical protein